MDRRDFIGTGIKSAAGLYVAGMALPAFAKNEVKEFRMAGVVRPYEMAELAFRVGRTNSVQWIGYSPQTVLLDGLGISAAMEFPIAQLYFRVGDWSRFEATADGRRHYWYETFDFRELNRLVKGLRAVT